MSTLSDQRAAREAAAKVKPKKKAKAKAKRDEQGRCVKDEADLATPSM